MLSSSTVHLNCPLTSATPLHRFDPTVCFETSAPIGTSFANTSSRRRDNLYCTTSSSVLRRNSFSFNYSTSNHFSRYNSLELDACWRGNDNQRQAMRLPDLTTKPDAIFPTEPVCDLYEFLNKAQLDHYYTIFSKHLKIRSVQQLKYVTNTDLEEMCMSGPEQRRLKKFFEKQCPRTTMGKLRKKLSRSTSFRSMSVCRPTDLPGRSPNSGERHMIGYRVIPSCDLDVASILGQGEFARVHQGLWRSVTGQELQVAVKILDLDKFPTKTEDFLKEAALMHNLDHPDIVRLYGICVTPNCLKLVTELAPLRSLIECLKEPDLRLKFPVSILHNFCIQIARGMTYLEEERLVHRDLAARNVLVFSTEKVKIGDFGLSRALQLGKSYYQTNFNANLRLPVAWCSPESIHDLRFTSASDVWSFGVTMWEIFTYGFIPWLGLSGKQILEAVDAPSGRRLEQPNACPDAVYDAVMRSCWNHEPSSRPTFSQLTEMLPRLSPQAWSVVADYQGDEESLQIRDIRSLLNPQPNTEEVETNTSADIMNGSSTKRKPKLSVRANENVYVLSKKDPEMWKVVSHLTGRIGFLPLSNLRICPSEEVRTSSATKFVSTDSPQTGTLSRMRMRLSRREFSSRPGRGDGGPLRMNPDFISSPQNDFRHVGHVGADGSMFGDIGLVSGALSDFGKDDSPTGSCLTIESNSDKENPRLSDITLSEKNNSVDYGFAENRFDRSSLAKRTSPLSSPLENKQFLPITPADTLKTSILSDTGGSLFDMGSSFVDELFECFSLSTQVNSKVEREVVKEVASPLSKTIESEMKRDTFSDVSEKNTGNGTVRTFSQDHSDYIVSNQSTPSACEPSANSKSQEVSKRHSRSLANNTLTRALRKSSLRRTSLGHELIMTSALSLDPKFEATEDLTSRKDSRLRGMLKSNSSKNRQACLNNSQTPAISGPIIVRGSALDNDSTVIIQRMKLMETHQPIQSMPDSATSHGSSLTVISALSNSPFSYPTDSKFNSGSDGSLPHSDEVSQSEGQQLSSISTTPSISPAPSLSSMASSASGAQCVKIFPKNGTVFSVPCHGISGGGGLRSLRDRDAVFRATNNLPSSRSRAFKSQALPTPAGDRTSAHLKNRLSVSSAAQNFVSTGSPTVGANGDTISLDVMQNFSNSLSSTRNYSYATTSVSQSSSSSLESGVSLPSWSLASEIRTSALTATDLTGTSSVNEMNGSANDILNDWGLDLTTLLSSFGGDGLKVSFASEKTLNKDNTSIATSLKR